MAEFRFEVLVLKKVGFGHQVHLLFFITMLSMLMFFQPIHAVPMDLTHDENTDFTQPVQIYKDRNFDDMMNEVMLRMHMSMMQAGSNGDPNIDFAQQMIPLHQAAIDMVRVLKLYALKDNDIRNLSTVILAVQAAEITQMIGWLGNYQSSTNTQQNKTAYEAVSIIIMGQMYEAMINADQIGDPSYDFMSMMVPHHQGAIDMAAAYLEVSDGPQLANLAQRIITAQQQEIDMMQHWLDNYKRVSDADAQD